MILSRVLSYVETPRLSDSLSSFTDVASDLQSLSEQLVSVRDQVLSCIENIDSSGFSQSLSEELSRELLSVRASLSTVECGQLYVDELISAKSYVATHPDHRNVEVLRYGLLQLAAYISDLAEHKQERTTLLLGGFNEFAALRGSPLMSETLLAVPAPYRVPFESLQQFRSDGLEAVASENHFSRDASYLEFSQLVLSIYRGEKRLLKLQQLSEYFEQLARFAADDKARGFWLVCSAYAESVNVSAGELRPAVFKVFKQIEKVVMAAFAGSQAPVLGMQESVDQLLCNLLCTIECEDYKGEHSSKLEAEFEVTAALQILESHREQELQSGDIWLKSSTDVLWSELHSCIEQLGDEATFISDGSLTEYIDKVDSLKRHLMLTGVHSARDNLQEVTQYLKQPATPEILKSCVTSLQLVEQQMLYQFDFLDKGSEQTSVEGEEHRRSAQAQASTSAIEASADFDTDSSDFAARGNSYIDVIQQALDTALGSSGNLMPDNSVISALNQLVDIVSEKGIDELTELLTPLAQFLTESENSTLNQSETLLVQEAIIAATLGIDSLVGQKPMPNLVVDVTARIKVALSASNDRTQSDHQHGEYFDSFLNEAEELLPRLFELFQRWRGAPFASSRLHGDISRLLHSLKQSAEEVGEPTLSTMVHYLESTMLDLRHSDAPPSQGFFDLAIESVEWLSDDIDRLRNNESAGDSSDLIDRLKLAGAVDASANDTFSVGNRLAFKKLPDDSLVDQVTIDNSAHAGSAQSQTSEPPGLVIVGNEPAVTNPASNWPKHFARADHCYSAINSKHDRLIALQKKLDAALNETANNNTGAIADNAAGLQLLADELAEITRSQTASIGHLGRQLSAAAQVGLQSMRASLIASLTATAKENACRVQFAFESGEVEIHRDLASQLLCALDPLLQSIVASGFEPSAERLAKGKSELPMLEVQFVQTDVAISVEIIDNGAGVTVHGAEVRSSNPWQRTAQAGWDQFEQNDSSYPSVLSDQDGAPIDIAALLQLAVRHGATVAVESDDRGARYRLTLPRLASVQEVLVVEVQQQQFALSAAQIVQVSMWSGDKTLSLASLVGVRKKSAFGAKQPQEHHVLQCKTPSGVHELLVDRVVGHQSLQFTAANRLLPDVPGYLGAAVSGGDQIVKWLDLNYWFSLN